jgi:hypothetical protein
VGCCLPHLRADILNNPDISPPTVPSKWSPVALHLLGSGLVSMRSAAPAAEPCAALHDQQTCDGTFFAAAAQLVTAAAAAAAMQRWLPTPGLSWML